MRKLIIIVTLVAAPLVAAAPAAATADRQAAVSSVAAAVTAGSARDGLAHPPSAPPVPQIRDAATPGKSADTTACGQTATRARHNHERAEKASAVAGAPAARALACGMQARAPPESA